MKQSTNLKPIEQNSVQSTQIIVLTNLFPFDTAKVESFLCTNNTLS